MTDEPNKFAVPFDDMAARIRRNDVEEFAGAILIVPPAGEPIAVMVADPSKSLEAFWAQAQQRINVAVSDFTQENRGGNAGWPRNR